MKKALLIVDVQEFFMNTYTKHVWPKIAAHVKATPYDVILYSLFQNTPDSNFVKSLHRDKCMWGDDIRIHEALLQRVRDDNVFPANTYSVFKQPQFMAYVKEHGLTSFDVCGVDTNACIIATVFDGFDMGYTMEVLPDMCASHSGYLYHDASIQIIDKCINKGMLEQYKKSLGEEGEVS